MSRRGSKRDLRRIRILTAGRSGWTVVFLSAPESWNVGQYRNRASAWLQKAETLPAGRERDACLTLPTARRSWPRF